MSDIVLDDKRLKQLIKAFGSNLPEIRLGVLGGGSPRRPNVKAVYTHAEIARMKPKKTEGSTPTNALIGAAHEFGTSRLPMRSWLRMPLTDQLQNFLDKAGAFDQQKLTEVIRSGTIKPWVAKIAIVGEAVVAEGFATGGFGKWTPSNMTYKQNHQTLVETQQLRNSVTSEVK